MCCQLIKLAKNWVPKTTAIKNIINSSSISEAVLGTRKTMEQYNWLILFTTDSLCFSSLPIMLLSEKYLIGKKLFKYNGFK